MQTRKNTPLKAILPPMRPNEKTGALLSDTDASEQSLVAAAEELNSAVSALTVSIIKLDKADGTKYFGQGGTWGSTAECFDKQFDGDVSTYTDYAGTMDGIGGFDIGEGAASVPTGLRFYLRTGARQPLQEHAL